MQLCSVKLIVVIAACEQFVVGPTLDDAPVIEDYDIYEEVGGAGPREGQP